MKLHKNKLHERGIEGPKLLGSGNTGPADPRSNAWPCCPCHLVNALVKAFFCQLA